MKRHVSETNPKTASRYLMCSHCGSPTTREQRLSKDHQNQSNSVPVDHAPKFQLTVLNHSPDPNGGGGGVVEVEGPNHEKKNLLAYGGKYNGSGGGSGGTDMKRLTTEQALSLSHLPAASSPSAAPRHQSSRKVTIFCNTAGRIHNHEPLRYPQTA